MELLIGMLLSSIVIGMCYYSIAAYSKQFSMFKKNKIKLWNIIQFQSVLNENCFATNHIKYSNGKLEIEDSENKIWNYYFFDSLVLRDHDFVVDSFFLKIKNVTNSNLENSKSYADDVIEGLEIQSVLAPRACWIFREGTSIEIGQNLIFYGENDSLVACKVDEIKGKIQRQLMYCARIKNYYIFSAQ
jgi:hypothetical protein